MYGASFKQRFETENGNLLSPMYGASGVIIDMLLDIHLLSPMYGASENERLKEFGIVLLSPMYGASVNH